MRVLHIASNHVDIMCDDCKSAFEVREGDEVRCGCKDKKSSASVFGNLTCEVCGMIYNPIREHKCQGYVCMICGEYLHPNKSHKCVGSTVHKTPKERKKMSDTLAKYEELMEEKQKKEPFGMKDIEDALTYEDYKRGERTWKECELCRQPFSHVFLHKINDEYFCDECMCSDMINKPILKSTKPYESFSEYWDTRIESYKKYSPAIFERTGLMNLLFDEAYNLWKTIYPPEY